MLEEIALDVLRCLDRTALEALKIHSRYLRDLLKRHAGILALRYIHDVRISWGTVEVRRMEDDRHGIKFATEGQQSLEEFFHHVNNAFLRRFTLRFHPAEFRYLYHLRANANRLQCQIRILRIDGTGEKIDHALVRFLAVQLKPQVFELLTCGAGGLRETHVMLFTHDAMCGNIKHLVYDLYSNTAPACIIPELFRVDAVQTCAITTEVDPRPWIRKFVERFANFERGTVVVPSVTLLHLGHESTLRHTANPLGQPQRTDAPTPDSAFVMNWFGSNYYHGAIESSAAELFVFENAWFAKKLEVFAWTVKQVFTERSYAFHRAFLLQVVDI